MLTVRVRKMRPPFVLSCLVAAASVGASCTASTRKVDVHAHFVPDFYATALRDAQHTPGPDGMPAIPVRLPCLCSLTLSHADALLL